MPLIEDRLTCLRITLWLAAISGLEYGASHGVLKGALPVHGQV